MFLLARDHFYSALFPQLCMSCFERPALLSGGNSCDTCWEKTILFDDATGGCSKCGRPAAYGVANQIKCWQCDGHAYEKARSIGIYSHALQAAVVGLKTQPHISKRLGSVLFETFERNRFQDSSRLVPVPLSKQRMLERGFNQANVIAELLSRRSGIPVDPFSLSRTNHSSIHRVGMDEKARDLSVKDSFAVVRPKLIVGQKILLIDDVLTTGATVSYCAKALKKAGAVEVNVLTLARAI